MERAIAGGVSGGVIGALDAGIKTAMNGGSVGEVLQAVQDGFVLGAALGTALGAGTGALEGRGTARLTEQVDELQRLLRDDPEAFATRFNELMSTMTGEQRAAFGQELQGRRFVDAEHYGPAAEAYESGMSSMPPEHRYGQEPFDDWSEAASFMDEHARSGEPLTIADVEAAHGQAARGITDEAGRLRTVGTEEELLVGFGGIGHRRAFSALSPEQIAILESNPHIRLWMRGTMDEALTPEQVAASFETAIIAYPNADTVAARMDDFFAWYGVNHGCVSSLSRTCASRRGRSRRAAVAPRTPATADSTREFSERVVREPFATLAKPSQTHTEAIAGRAARSRSNVRDHSPLESVVRALGAAVARAHVIA